MKLIAVGASATGWSMPLVDVRKGPFRRVGPLYRCMAAFVSGTFGEVSIG